MKNKNKMVAVPKAQPGRKEEPSKLSSETRIIKTTTKEEAKNSRSTKKLTGSAHQMDLFEDNWIIKTHYLS